MQKTKISANIVGDSLSPQGDRLISVLCTFPRFILAEVNTHRMLSKNTSSSRAIPFNKMVETIQDDPFIPIAWQKDHKGMQGTEYFTEEKDIQHNIRMWLHARDYAVQSASAAYSNFNITKQLCNRILEPYMWTTMLITGSKEGWDNFFNLRLPEYHLENVPTINEDLSLNPKTLTLVGKSKKELLKQINEIDNDSYTGFKTIINSYSDLDWLKINKGQAEIHMMQLAECIYDAINESTPQKLRAGEWHIPFGKNIDIYGHFKMSSYEPLNEKGVIKICGSDIQTARIKVSTAMAARTSYTIVGDEKEIDYKKMIELHDRLIVQKPLHASPMEHCARVMTNLEYDSFARGQLDLHDPDHKSYWNNEDTIGWCRNYKGFIQYRHILETK